MLHTRSSALGTRMVVAPPPASVVLDTRDGVRQRGPPGGATRLTRPTSAPQRRTTGSETKMAVSSSSNPAGSSLVPATSSEKRTGSGSSEMGVRVSVGRKHVGEARGKAVGNSETVVPCTARSQARPCKARTRPLSARPSSETAMAAGDPLIEAPASRRRRRPWDEASGANGRSGVTNGRDECRFQSDLLAYRDGRRGHDPGIYKAALVATGASDAIKERTWTSRMSPAVRKVSFAANSGSPSTSCRDNASAHSTYARSSSRAGRPYMSRADAMAEASNEIASLRGLVETLKTEAQAARDDADTARMRVESVEDHICAVLRQTAEVLPDYRYGLQLGTDGEEQGERSEVAVLEHRKALEKTAVVRRLRGQVQRLTQRLTASESELAHLRRCCEATAVREMHAASEEYALEVGRLRAELVRRSSSSDAALGCARQSPRPIAAEEPPMTRSAKSSLPVGSEINERLRPLHSPGGEHEDASYGDRSASSLGIDTNETTNVHRPFHASAPNKDLSSSPSWVSAADCREPSTAHAVHDDLRAQNICERPHRACHPTVNVQQNTTNARDEATRFHRSKKSLPRDGGRRSHESVRARAGLLGVRFPCGNRKGPAIEGPMRSRAVSAANGESGRGGHSYRAEVADARGRVTMTTEMEVDVMKGLVLAQQHRIERQRSKVQELERDLREFRRASQSGGEWPQALAPFSAAERPKWQGAVAGLRSSRSAPAGLDVRRSLHESGTSIAVVRSHRTRHVRRATPLRVRRSTREASATNAVCEGHSNEADSHVPETVHSLRASRSGLSANASDRASSPCATGGAPRTESNQRTFMDEDVADAGESGTVSESLPSMRGPSDFTIDTVGADHSAHTAELEGSQTCGAGMEAQLLPRGWAQAVDEDTGHVYYYSDSRSTWVRPTTPASAQDPFPGEGIEGETESTTNIRTSPDRMGSWPRSGGDAQEEAGVGDPFSPQTFGADGIRRTGHATIRGESTSPMTHALGQGTDQGAGPGRPSSRLARLSSSTADHAQRTIRESSDSAVPRNCQICPSGTTDAEDLDLERRSQGAPVIPEKSLRMGADENSKPNTAPMAPTTLSCVTAKKGSARQHTTQDVQRTDGRHRQLFFGGRPSRTSISAGGTAINAASNGPSAQDRSQHVDLHSPESSRASSAGSTSRGLTNAGKVGCHDLVQRAGESEATLQYAGAESCGAKAASLSLNEEETESALVAFIATLKPAAPATSVKRTLRERGEESVLITAAPCHKAESNAVSHMNEQKLERRESRRESGSSSLSAGKHPLKSRDDLEIGRSCENYPRVAGDDGQAVSASLISEAVASRGGTSQAADPRGSPLDAAARTRMTSTSEDTHVTHLTRYHCLPSEDAPVNRS